MLLFAQIVFSLAQKLTLQGFWGMRRNGPVSEPLGKPKDNQLGPPPALQVLPDYCGTALSA